MGPIGRGRRDERNGVYSRLQPNCLLAKFQHIVHGALFLGYVCNIYVRESFRDLLRPQMQMSELGIITAAPDDRGSTVGTLSAGILAFRCAFGKNGLTTDKMEGDGATPVGDWRLRKLYYRADRLTPPGTALALAVISPTGGWCDDPTDPRYNEFVELPCESSHETLHRDDHLYDLMIPLGYNDVDIVPGKGSAIFFHLAKESYRPTEGCVAISRRDMEQLLPMLSSRTVLRVTF